MSLAHAWTAVGAAFLASLVECVEALTVVLAVGSVRGWRNAFAGAAAALLVLGAIVALLGSTLMRVPLHALQAVVGVLLLLFGLRWLRKAVLRAAGVIALHDETAAFAKNMTSMQAVARGRGWDKLALATSFNITMLEGTEVVFIVIAIGAGVPAALLRASAGATAALVLVAALGFVLHRPLARVPENALKFMVGVLLSAFGTFWTGEGLRVVWPGEDWALLGLTGVYLVVAIALVAACRSRKEGSRGAAT